MVATTVEVMMITSDDNSIPVNSVLKVKGEEQANICSFSCVTWSLRHSVTCDALLCVSADVVAMPFIPGSNDEPIILALQSFNAAHDFERKQ